MDKATAKRDACWHLARLAEDNLTSTLWLDIEGDLAAFHGYDEADMGRVQDAMRVLIAELTRRGHK